MMKIELLAMFALWTTILLYPLDALVLPMTRQSDGGDCFDIYNRSLDKAATDYTKNYAKCQETARSVKTRAGIDKQAERIEIETEATTVCERLRSCGEMEEHLDFFQCHSDMGLINIHSMMVIHTNSSKILVDLQDEQEQAEKARKKCEMDADAEFKKQVGLSYVELNNCISQQQQELL